MQSKFFWQGIRSVCVIGLTFSYQISVTIDRLCFAVLCDYQLVENDKIRNGNREALTALRKQARTTKTSVPSPFEVIMKDMEGSSGKQLIKEICPTCGDHDPKEHTWLMFPGSDIFARVPFHVAHTVLEKDQERLDFDTKKLQSFVKEKSLVIAEKGALAGRFGADTVKSLVSLTDTPKSTREGEFVKGPEVKYQLG
ncbi:unnamed protein product [Urochloa decumbens]|uniref:P53 and DNA damage-regulated protein 1 n=1 Tax=Urochloa decumbens TaxID=240449 RepID=A0ABC9FYJ0_9POAL